MDRVTAAAILVAAVFLIVERFGLLDRLGITRPSARVALAELDLSGRQIERLRTERDQANARVAVLEKERSLTPILEAVQGVLETQQQTLAKLAHFNGALARQEEGLREATEALRMVAGLVVGAVDIPTPKREPT